MDDKVLVAYATRHGSTVDIANIIASVIREAGAEVDVALAEHMVDVRPYKAVLVASPVYRGKILDGAAAFVTRFAQALKSKRVAYVLNGLTMRKDTPANRAKMMQSIASLPGVNLVEVGLFAGTGAHLSWPLRMLVRLMGMTPKDLRDWDAIRVWTHGLLPRLGIG
jgi:menaquinone-dependent protoporphyrinogen oxidase